MTKLKLMSMQELDEASKSQDGNEFSRELFRRELKRRETSRTRKNISNAFASCNADYVLL